MSRVDNVGWMVFLFDYMWCWNPNKTTRMSTRFRVSLENHKEEIKVTITKHVQMIVITCVLTQLPSQNYICCTWEAMWWREIGSHWRLYQWKMCWMDKLGWMVRMYTNMWRGNDKAISSMCCTQVSQSSIDVGYPKWGGDTMPWGFNCSLIL